MNRTMSLVAGVVLLGLGAFVLLQGGSVTSREDVVSLGDMKITAKESHPIPPWAAGIAVAAGIVLLVGGARKRT